METQAIEKTEVNTDSIINGKFKSYNPFSLSSEALDAAFSARIEELKNTVPELAEKQLDEIPAIAVHEMIKRSFVDDAVTEVFNKIGSNLSDLKDKRNGETSLDAVLAFKKLDYQIYIESCKLMKYKPVNFISYSLGFPLYENKITENSEDK